MKRIFFSLGLLTLVACPLFAQTSNLGLAADQPQEQPSRFPTELEVSLSPKDIVYATRDIFVLQNGHLSSRLGNKPLPAWLFSVEAVLAPFQQTKPRGILVIRSRQGYVVVAINYVTVWPVSKTKVSKWFAAWKEPSVWR